MAIHANSIPAPARPLLRLVAGTDRPSSEAQHAPLDAKAPPSGGLLPDRRAELLAILSDAPTARSLGFMTRPQRQAIQDGIDALIDYLDAVDPDPDLEDDGCAEYNMGWSENGPREHIIPYMFCWDELEPDADEEPSLGSPETILTISYFLYGPPAMFDQTWWGSSGMSDRELVNEDGGDILDELHDAEEACYA